MSPVTIERGEFSVDATVIGQGLGLDPAMVVTGMRQRRITSVCERGVDEDAGRYRLTFFHAQRRLRLTVDATGTIIDCSSSSAKSCPEHAGQF